MEQFKGFAKEETQILLKLISVIIDFQITWHEMQMKKEESCQLLPRGIANLVNTNLLLIMVID